MRVLIAAQPSISMVAGGPLTQARQTARHLPEYGVEVAYFSQWEDIRREDFDLVHLFGANLATYDLAARLAAFEIPYVVSSIFFTSRSAAGIRLVRALERGVRNVISGAWTDYGFSRAVCEKARLVLPNSTAEANLVADGLGIKRSRIRVVPNGVDSRFAESDPELFIGKYGIRDFVLNVGHIGSPRKNVLRLIRALRQIDRPAVIIGKIHRNKYAGDCLREAGRNPNIHIIEGLPNDSPMLASAFAAARVFALPSTYETPGIAALEAGLAGANIVITKYGGTEDYFGGMADYVEPRSIKSIAQGIRTALDRPADPALRQRIHDEFLWPQVARKTAAAYRAATESP